MFSTVRTTARTTARSTTAGRRTAGLALSTALVFPAVAVTTAARASAQSQDSRPVGDRVLDEAPKHDGKPYRYRATGPDAFDCSGFVQYIFGQVGVAIPRTSGDQYSAAQPIAQQDRRPGDLIAMRNSSGAVTHVGVYGGHDDWWVESTSAGRVVLQDLYSTNYSVGRFS